MSFVSVFLFRNLHQDLLLSLYNGPAWLLCSIPSFDCGVLETIWKLQENCKLSKKSQLQDIFWQVSMQ